MRHDVQIQVLERLLAGGEAPPLGVVESRVAVDVYRDPEQAENERRVLFGALPLCLAHASELSRPGDFVTRQVADTAILLVRDKNERVRAFVNVCRHRGSPLAHHKQGTGCKAFVCPYHGWVYGLEGQLLHVPGEKFFPDLDKDVLGLVPLPAACAHGFVWVAPRPTDAPNPAGDPAGQSTTIDLASYLGRVDDDLSHFGLGSHALFRKSERVRQRNWKRIIDAFLEGHHLSPLGRGSIDRSSGERGVIFDFFGRHIRSVGARENIDQEIARPRAEWDIRACATPFYLLFPNTVVIVQPDYISLLTVEPMSVDRSFCTHYMLVPEPAATDEDSARYQRSFDLIDGTVFSEDIQRGLGSRAHDHFALGTIEYPIRMFHDHIAALLG